MPRNRGNLVQSMLSFDTYSSKVKSDFLNAKSKLSSAMSKINSIEKERKVARKQLPIPVQALQFTLSFFNFILFCIYVMLFGFTVSSILMVLNEDCLKVAPSYNFLPERVPPNTVRGYECTGIRLIEKNDYFQILLLVLLTVAIGIQMISCDLAFTGAVTLTVRNIKLSIWLFASSALLLIIFILFDFPLSTFIFKYASIMSK